MRNGHSEVKLAILNSLQVGRSCESMKAARCALAGRRPTFMTTCTRSLVVRRRLVRAWCAVVWFVRGCNVELWSPGGSPVDWKESRKGNLHVEGKLHLRCAEQVN